MRKALVVLLVVSIVGGALFAFSLHTAGASKPKYTFATVVKSVAFNWFKRMNVGIKKFGKDFGVKAFMTGPSQADSAQQIAIIQSLIAQHVDAIMNVPYGVVQQEDIQKKAMDAGIVVVDQEAANGKNYNYDVEAFDNKSYGEEMMKQLAARMHYKGEYIQFVGSLTNASHMEWMKAAKAYQEKHYPKMKCIGLYESKETVPVPYKITKDVLVSHPNLKGVMGSAALDVVGAARAIVAEGLGGKIAVVGTSVPSYCGNLLKTGAISLIMCWDPALAGYVANEVAYYVLTGKPITNGMNLKVPGFEHIKIVKNKYGFPVIYGKGWLEINAANQDKYKF